jgi:hypothetical protein
VEAAGTFWSLNQSQKADPAPAAGLLPHTLRSADAIQLVCAAHFGVDLFITNGKHLHKLNVPGIGFIAPLDKVPL